MAEKPRRDTLRIAEEAAEWLEALPDSSAQTQADFAAWLRASPRHVEEMLMMQALDREADKVDATKRIDIATLLAETGANVVSIAAPSEETLTPSLSHKWRGSLILKVAGVAAMGVALGLALMMNARETFVTAIGEQRALELEDGSIVHLNARSRMTVDISKQARDVQLFEGEALFKVAHDAARPFRVHAGDAVIRAVGTQFNVYRRTSGTTVSVLEGRVEISRESMAAPPASELTAGEAVQIPQRGEATRMRADAAEAIAWRQRRLIFRDSTLADIAVEFNRYNRTPQITIEGAALRARRYGGTFDADDPESLVDFLRPDIQLEITHIHGNLIIRPRIMAQ